MYTSKKLIAKLLLCSFLLESCYHFNLPATSWHETNQETTTQNKQDNFLKVPISYSSTHKQSTKHSTPAATSEAAYQAALIAKSTQQRDQTQDRFISKYS